MNTQSNSYTIIYATVLVLIVAAVLSVLATALNPIQTKNIEIEKKQNILSSLHVQTSVENAETLFDRYITDKFTINSSGERINETDPFYINLRDELRKPLSERQLPVFLSEKKDTTYVVIPVYGKGLWGPIWGYISVQPVHQDSVGMAKTPEYRSIYGAFFDHKSETPGLGAEISQPFFQQQFRDKYLFNDNGKFVGIKVVKRKSKGGSLNEVDAISGGTITSKGVQAMLDTCLSAYQTYLQTVK